MRKSENCDGSQYKVIPNFTPKICPKQTCTELKTLECVKDVKAFAYFYNRARQTVPDREDVVFTDTVGSGISSDRTVPVSGFYNIKYKAIVSGILPVFLGLFKNGQLVTGSKYGTTGDLASFIQQINAVQAQAALLKEQAILADEAIAILVGEISSELAGLVLNGTITQSQMDTALAFATNQVSITQQINTLGFPGQLDDLLDLLIAPCPDLEAIIAALEQLQSSSIDVMNLQSKLVTNNQQFNVFVTGLLSAATPTISFTQAQIDAINTAFSIQTQQLGNDQWVNVVINDLLAQIQSGEGREIVADIIADLGAGDIISLKNLSCFTITIPELVAPYPPNGINVEMVINLLAQK